MGYKKTKLLPLKSSSELKNITFYRMLFYSAFKKFYYLCVNFYFF